MTNPFAPKTKDSFELSFTSSHCSTQNFRIKEIANLRCPACGLIMLTEQQISMYVRDVSTKKGQDLVDALEKYEDESVLTGKPSKDTSGFGIYRPMKKDVVDVYKRLALEYPDKDLLGLTKIEAQRCIDELIAEQMEVIDEVRSYIDSNFSNDEKEDLHEKIDDFVDQINGDTQEQFARKKFIYAMKKAVPKEHQDNIDEIASKLPTSENDVNSFFVKYAKAANSSSVIASKFVNQSIPTAEHLIPRAAGGKNKLENYICDCADCNSKRGHTPFYDWLQTLPGFEDRLQLYIQDVRDAIDDDLFHDSPEYDSYIEKVIETLAEISEGEVILEIPETTNPAKNAVIIEKRRKEIAKIKAKNETLTQRRDTIKEEIAELKKYPHFAQVDEHRGIIAKLAEIDEEINKLDSEATSLRAPLYNLKKEIEALEAQVINAQSPQDKALAQKQYTLKCSEYDQKEAQLDRTEGRCKQFKRKKVDLKKRKKHFATREEEVRTKAEGLLSLVGKIESLSQKINKAGNIAHKEADLSAKIQTSDDIISKAQQENDTIASKEGFDVSDSSKHNEYNHQKDLLKTANNLLENKSYKKTNANAGFAREIIEIAKKTIMDEVQRLQELDEVKYFINLTIIKNETEKKTRLEKNYKEISAQKREIDTLQAQIDNLCQGKTPEEIKKEHKAINTEKQIIDEIHKIGAKRERLEHLTKIVQKNNEILAKLANYQTLTNAQYHDLIDFIDLDDIY